jgi:integrase
MGVFKRYSKSNDGTKTAYWYIRYSVDGKEKWESVGKVGVVTKMVAQRKLEDVRKKIRRGVYGHEDVTLEELESDYIEYIKNVKKLRSWKDRETHLKVLKAFFGGKKLSQITPRDIEDFKLIYLKTHKPAGVNRVLATLRNVYNLARRWKKFYGENPVSVSGLLSEDNLRDRVLLFEEEERLLSASAVHLKPIIITALNTGMRRGELLSLKWGNVDLENNLIIITAANNKSKKTKRVPVNSVLSTMLRELKFRNQKKSEYVFLGDDDKPVKDIKTAYLNACRRAGIQSLRFHDLRHTAGTRMVESGVGIVAISKILGHASVELTMKRYLHPEDSLRDAVEKLGNFNENRSKNRSNEERETS